MLNKCLGATLVIIFLQIFFIRAIPEPIRVSVWEVYLLLQAFLISLVCNQLISYKNQKTKSLNFVILIFSAYNLVSYFAEWFSAGLKIYPYVILAFNIILFCCIIPITALIISRSLIPEPSSYFSDGSYLVYKKPTNWSGLMGLVFQAPYGHCSLVTSGRVFKFKHGEIVEENYVEQKEDLLVKILPVKLEDARELIGTPWSLNNNCFNIFKKFK